VDDEITQKTDKKPEPEVMQSKNKAKEGKDAPREGPDTFSRNWM